MIRGENEHIGENTKIVSFSTSIHSCAVYYFLEVEVKMIRDENENIGENTKIVGQTKKNMYRKITCVRLFERLVCG